ncbi:MAG: peptidase T [Christensenellaceae bacterium]|jgi:tripeptide aminopeptidase
MSVQNRFLEYISFESASDDKSDTIPSSPAQKTFGAFLVEELKSIGVMDAYMDEKGYVYGSVPANVSVQLPKIGLIAHMDTYPGVSGKDITPRIVSAYDGTDIVLNAAEDIVLSPSVFPNLKNYVGQDLIVTDGTTLLGADDKAGIAEIIAAIADIIEKDLPHGDIKIGFTPDEEIGRGADHFDVAAFAADYAYTVDGGALGGLEYENFNAADAIIEIKGKSIHTGSAKGQMKNAILIGMEFHAMLPAFENPAYTEGYEGFAHLDEIAGDVEDATLTYILRDHDLEKLEARKTLFLQAATFLNEKYGADTVCVTLRDRYRNMKEKILPRMEIIERAKAAMEKAGVTPVISPIRGGTDGATLSFMGLPCPNLCTGGENFHGRYEFISIQSMEKCVEILKNILLGVIA